MPNWIWIFIILAGGLFVLKMAYALSVALVLPVTKGALYVSTSNVRIAAFMEAVPMKTAQLLVDLGCGDGRVLRKARKTYGVRAIGFELNPLAYLSARVACLGTSSVEIRFQSFWKADLSKADIVFCYLFPDVMKPLANKLRSELKPGAVIVSCNFVLPDMVPERVLRPGNSLHNDPIYIYRIREVKAELKR
ncbi:MAG: class I SAM-dependent methyltransferase [Deltaproteobacteria bacterium]|nr:MAG: class I SAM-dependent methyltransferase [Deltaproteobacteria bacterium]